MSELHFTRFRRKSKGHARTMMLGAFGIGSLALVVIVSSGVHAYDPAGSPADAPVSKAQEAPSGFNNTSNGFESQADFDKDRLGFEKVEGITPDGLGPVYNGTSCVGCHQDPITGSSSQNAELRIGHEAPDPLNKGKTIFVEPPSGSLIHQRAIDASVQEHVPDGYEVHALRMSSSILGDGYIEVIPDSDILKILAAQPKGLKGLPVLVPVPINVKKGSTTGFDFNFAERIGRFGWKCQEASLINFCAEAYLNEMGVTSPLQPSENTSNGRSVSQFDLVPDPEDLPDPGDKDTEHPFGDDIKSFTRFIRSTKVPPRDFDALSIPDVIEGEKLFRNNALLGCAVCHQPDYTTPPAGTPIKPFNDSGTVKSGSDMSTVPAALGNVIIHPFSDFMLHDIGTGDGIAQTQHAQKPPKGIANLERVSSDVLAKQGIARVKADTVDGNRRALSPDVMVLDQRTVDKVRTAPLWGLRVRPQMLHDGSALTIDQAIRRHQGQAMDVTARYEKLTPTQTRQLIAFLGSL